MQVYATTPKSVLRLRPTLSVVHPPKLSCTTAYIKIQDPCFQGLLLHFVTEKVAKRQLHTKKSLDQLNPILLRVYTLTRAGNGPNPLSLNPIIPVHPGGLLRLHHKSSEMCESPVSTAQLMREPYCSTGIGCARNAYTEDQ
ncbi:hypothetical protein M9H77_08744 [Catharanthus roseus]|uniref:Uncharacterized protein n=1 Tax=Catharanthus roseus TaxID=4058 RepID=A0ACC0BYM9_CATRO|nr:hypothetical protein M9H77_08744 [Catharanthus roseus]